ncbi:MAG TPA: hypothetical protein VHJ20_06655 [Polyangia bacterium]|nr:hypothetical protein [Polyangia bacterium]
MRVTQILDLIVLLLLATVILMPRPDATVKPALALGPELQERAAELQSVLVGKPAAVEPALELANLYLDGHRPDWALATIGPALHERPDDYRLHHVRAIAYADRFDPDPAFEAAKRASELCEAGTAPAGTPPCGPAVQARLALLKSALGSVAGVDMKNQPYLAKDRIFHELHPAFVPKPPKPKATTAAPPEKP